MRQFSSIIHTLQVSRAAGCMRTFTSSRSKQVNFGVIGAGRIGKIHLEGLRQHNANVVAVCDPRGDLALNAATQFDIPRHTKDDSEVLQDPNIDAIVICSLTDQHAGQIIHAAKHKKHIFCEKPIDLDLENVNKALNAVEKAGVKFMVGFNRRFDANFKRLKQAISHGEVGELSKIRITSRDPSPPPISYIKSSGGMFNDMTIHDFDMARFLVGAEVDEVFVMAQARDPEIEAAGDIDTAVCLLRFKNGVLGYIENSRVAAYGYDQRVEVLGSKGKAACENNFPNNVTISTGEAVKRDLPLHFFLERYMPAYLEEMKAFIQVCQEDTLIPVGGHDGREALLLAMAADLSRKENRPVKVDEMRK